MLLRTLFLCSTLLAYVSVTAGQDVDFNRDIRPILSENCFQCHGPDENAREADLRLDTRDGLLGRGEESAIIVPGKPVESELIRRMTTDDQDERMPPPDSNRGLSADEIAKIERWVADGAQWQQHWAFETPQRPEMPQINNAAWPLNAIDFFILAKLESEGLSPSDRASPEKLIRRVTLDLTGIPPTIAEIDAFLNDPSPNAYEKVVDRLLDSPRYGEHMVWDWLDAARYADTNGFQGDPTRTMWPWRDWAIRALNDNMPFDQFTIEQLAGDLLPDATLDQRVASGFNRNHMHNGEGGRIAEETRVENVLDRVETTGTIWLGLTLTCARCHDHKFDPLQQREYYQLFAYFNNTSEDGGIRSGNVPPVVQVPTEEQTRKLNELAEQIRNAAEKIKSAEQVRIKTEKPSELDATKAAADASKPADAKPAPELSDELKQILAKAPDARSSPELQKLIDHFKDDPTDYPKLLGELKAGIDQRKGVQDAFVSVMVMDTLSTPRETTILDRGLYNKPKEKVSPNVPSVFPGLPADAPPDRLSLARWLVDPQHPLTARVTVNRYWQLFFGTGLVKTVEDFGVQGERPSHPELLDWLAVEFRESGWDVKAMHKLIVMSATYQQSAKSSAEINERDPENRLLSHGPRYRMPAWMIRDHALAVSGLLVEKQGGPPVKPYQPPGIWEEATFGKMNYGQDHGENLYRRSLYTFWRRIVGPTMFFDSAKRQTCSVRPSRTNTPLHALITLNDVTYVEAARVMAQRIMIDSNDSASRIESAFRLVTSRKPGEQETQILQSRLAALIDQYSQAPDEAKALIQTGEFARDETLEPIEHAAYTSLCLLLMNLDEALTK